MTTEGKIHSQIYNRLVSKIKQIDQKLINDYDSQISKIQQLRYDFFKKCVCEKKQGVIIATCYNQAQKFQLQPGFQKAANNLNQCINKAAQQRNWQKAIDNCLSSYQSIIRKGLDSEINRTLKFI